MKVHTATRLEGLEEYYFSRKLEQIRQLEAKGIDVINLGIGSPDLPPSQEVIQTLIEAAIDETNHSYQSYRGIPELRKSIAEFYVEHYDIEINWQTEILPLMGSKEGITHISMAFLNKGDEVLVPSLGYPTYTSVTKMMEAVPVHFPMDESQDWEPDWKFLDQLDTGKVKLMWANYPHMPTGQRASRDVLERLVAYAKERDVILCFDNPYSFILNDNPESILAVGDSNDHVLELNSLSKSFNMAGWRIGWVAGSEGNINNILKIKSNMDSGMLKPLQLAAIKALSLKEDWFIQLNEIYKRRKLIAHQILDAINCSYHQDQSGMFVWAKTPNVPGEELSDQLLHEHHVFITPGVIFGKEGGDFIRISLCTPEKRLNEVLDRISS